MNKATAPSLRKDVANEVAPLPPDHLYVEVFAACDMACPMCVTLPYWEGNRRMLSREDLRERVFRPAAERGIRRLLLSGGEPSLRKDIFCILEDAKMLGFQVWFATNLLRYDEDKLLRLLSVLDGKGHCVAVSFDSCVPSEMDLIRGGLVFETVEENCRQLHRLRRQTGSRVKTCSTMIVQAENRNSVAATIDLVLDGIGFDQTQVHLRHDFKSVTTENSARQTRADYCDQHEADLIRAGMVVHALAARDKRIRVRRGLEDWVQFVRDPQHLTLSCQATRFLFVNAEGVMRSCMFGLAYADLRQISLEEALSPERYDKIKHFVSGCNICNLNCN